MENLKKMTIAEAKERIKNEFCSLMTKEDVLRLLDELENCCEEEAKQIGTDSGGTNVPEGLTPDLTKKTDSNATDYKPFDSDNDKCKTYTVYIEEDIHTRTNETPGLNRGKVSIKIYDSNNPNTEFNLWTLGHTGKNGQNIYSYFKTECSQKAQGTSGCRYRNDAIRWWMEQNNIEQITVKVCPVY
jgi:hypothetical protein